MVDRKTVLTNLKNFYEWNFKNYPLNFDEAQVIIKALETEIPHAKWIDIGIDGQFQCSQCNCLWVESEEITHEDWIDVAHYCPHCGARMDGE